MFLVLMLAAVSAHAQSPRLDSLALAATRGVLDSVADARWTIDSSLSRFRGILPTAHGATELRVENIEALLDTSVHPATLEIGVVAVKEGNTRESRRWTTTVPVSLLSGDIEQLETNPSHFVQLRQTAAPQPSIWSDILEPALVVLAAGAIVALFFLIRS